MKKNSLIEYKIGRIPKVRSIPNKQSWLKIKRELAKTGSSTLEQLASLCEDHEHPTGGCGFVKYCINNQWLVATDHVLAPILYQKTEPAKKDKQRV